jgi:hypothetical protein
MKIKIIFLTLAAIVVIAGVLLFTNSKKKNPPTILQKVAPKAFKPVNACDLLTVDLAKSVIKGEVENDNRQSPDVNLANENVSLSTCTYISKEGTTLKDIKTVGLVIRQAKNEEGRKSNEFGFEENKKRESGSKDGMSKGLEELKKLGIDMSKASEELKKLGITPKESLPIEEVDILGQKAYFDPNLQQYSVLIKDSNFWIMVSGNNVEKSDLLSLTEKIIKHIN